jgi:hypothetical protein
VTLTNSSAKFRSGASRLLVIAPPVSPANPVIDPPRSKLAEPTWNDGGVTETPTKPSGRAGHGLRDMVLSLAVLLVVIGSILGITRSCSFSPGGPSVDQGAQPTVDAPAELRSAATRVEFPVREITLPQGWRANAATVSPVGTGSTATVAVRVGLVTSEGHYLRLSQSNAPTSILLVSEPGLDTDIPPSETGTQKAAGLAWTVYPGRPGEQTWVAKQKDVVFVISGSGTADEKRTIAATAASGAVLPNGRG